MTSLKTRESCISEDKNKLVFLAMLIFSIGTFTLETFISTPIIKVIYLFVVSILLITSYLINNNNIYIYKVDVLFVVFLGYFLFNILYHSLFTKDNLIDVLVFVFIMVILLLLKFNVNYFIYSVKILFVLSIIHSFSSIFQFINMDLYTRFILPRFGSERIEIILRLYNANNFTGFTTQTAYIAGYLVYGIGIAIIMHKETKNKFTRALMLLSIPVLFFSLLLSGKRAHLLFMVIALLLTYLISSNVKKIVARIMKLTIGGVFLTVTLIILLSQYNPDSNNPIGKMYMRISYTIESYMAGEDITSGRIYLYDYALKLFAESPIFGVGWGEFQKLSVGILGLDIGSHPHNIYFQLLTELGIIGFILFMIPVVYVFIRTIKLLMNSDVIFSHDSKWKVALQYSLYVQSFFLLYGITGNLLTDHIFLLMYFFAVSIVLSSMKYAKVQQESLNQEMKPSLKKNISPHSVSST